MPTPFTQPVQVTLDGTGAGQVVIGPAGFDWLVRRTSVKTSTAVKQPTATLYRGGVSDAAFLEGSFSGANDASDTVHLMQPGELLYCVWSGGDAGARATLVVSGLAYPPGEGIGAL
jgi:hypothetical protein